MKKKGISLIVLVITIIVIIILATAVIVTFVQNNPIDNAKNAVGKWNDKVLQEKADLFELDLLAEFQQQGLGTMILPDYAKEAYINAIKEGKTEEEARQIGKDSFIGNSKRWYLSKTNNGYIVALLLDKNAYTPLYNEVDRVYSLIINDEDGVVDLNIDTKLVPQDLVDCLNKLQADKIELANGNIDSTEFSKRRKENEPFWSFKTRRKDGKYYNEVMGAIYLPYFAYQGKNNDIYKLNDFEKDWVNGFDSLIRYATQLIIDPNYTELNKDAIPHVEGDTEIVFPPTLKRINKDALSYVEVNKLVIPSNVEYIDKDAFGLESGGYGSIQEVIIKKEKGSIPGEPWDLDTTITTIKWEPEE